MRATRCYVKLLAGLHLCRYELSGKKYVPIFRAAQRMILGSDSSSKEMVAWSDVSDRAWHTLEDLSPRAIQQNATSVIARRALTFSPRLSHQRLSFLCELLLDMHTLRVAGNRVAPSPPCKSGVRQGAWSTPCLKSSLPSHQRGDSRAQLHDGDASSASVCLGRPHSNGEDHVDILTLTTAGSSPAPPPVTCRSSCPIVVGAVGCLPARAAIRLCWRFGNSEGHRSKARCCDGVDTESGKVRKWKRSLTGSAVPSASWHPGPHERRTRFTGGEH